jgi:hypothetical protein
MLSDAVDDLIHILLGEDSPTDVMLPRVALEYDNVLNPLHVAEDRVIAMEYLRRKGRHSAAPRPAFPRQIRQPSKQVGGIAQVKELPKNFNSSSPQTDRASVGVSTNPTPRNAD